MGDLSNKLRTNHCGVCSADLLSIEDLHRHVRVQHPGSYS